MVTSLASSTFAALSTSVAALGTFATETFLVFELAVSATSSLTTASEVDDLFAAGSSLTSRTFTLGAALTLAKSEFPVGTFVTSLVDVEHVTLLTVGTDFAGSTRSTTSLTSHASAEFFVHVFAFSAG